MKSLLVFFLTFALISCSTVPQPISFGKDNCDFCRMTIVDNKFGAELITKKGKVYKFDSIECMINYMKENHINETATAQTLVVDYTSGGSLINATTANFLQSEKLQSPMGAGLSAYSAKNEAEKMQQQFGGEFSSWNQLKAKN